MFALCASSKEYVYAYSSSNAKISLDIRRMRAEDIDRCILQLQTRVKKLRNAVIFVKSQHEPRSNCESTEHPLCAKYVHRASNDGANDYLCSCSSYMTIKLLQIVKSVVYLIYREGRWIKIVI